MSKRATDYTNASQQRILSIVLALFSEPINGFTPSRLAELHRCPQPMITRDMDNLRTAGYAVRDEATGNWMLAPRIGQQAIKIFNAIDAADRRVEEARNRFTRNPD